MRGMIQEHKCYEKTMLLLVLVVVVGVKQLYQKVIFYKVHHTLKQVIQSSGK